jgi:hypothetical protein
LPHAAALAVFASDQLHPVPLSPWGAGGIVAKKNSGASG